MCESQGLIRSRLTPAKPGWRLLLASVTLHCGWWLVVKHSVRPGLRSTSLDNE